jgi:hypothetical protein
VDTTTRTDQPSLSETWIVQALPVLDGTSGAPSVATAPGVKTVGLGRPATRLQPIRTCLTAIAAGCPTGDVPVSQRHNVPGRAATRGRPHLLRLGHQRVEGDLLAVQIHAHTMLTEHLLAPAQAIENRMVATPQPAR